VVATHINLDTELTDLTIATGDGVQTLKTTYHHPFWSLTRLTWIDAHDLQPGEELRVDGGAVATVVGLVNYGGFATMYDLTVEEIHTYHVVVGDSPVLVHNCGGAYDWKPGNRPGLATDPQGPLPPGSWVKRGETLAPGNYHYVVMKNGSLRAMEDDAMWDIDESAGHTSLARNRAVHMAGQFEVDVFGKIAKFDNWSGHYGPRDSPGYTSLEKLARAAFKKHGLPVHPKAVWTHYDLA
jgi:hypothetical protein